MPMPIAEAAPAAADAGRPRREGLLPPAIILLVFAMLVFAIGGFAFIGGQQNALNGLRSDADAMREALAEVAKSKPVVPVVANVVVRPLTDPLEIVDRLVEQVTGQVRWRETVEWFAANGVTSLYEIGSGKVLTGLVRRIDKSLAGTAVNTSADIEAALAALNG